MADEIQPFLLVNLSEDSSSMMFPQQKTLDVKSYWI